MKEMILNNAKAEGKLYIVQDLLQDGKPIASWNMRGTVLKNAKDMLMCNPARLHWSGSGIKFHVRS